MWQTSDTQLKAFSNELEKDFSGCVWSDGSPELEFLTWLSSWRQSIDENVLLVNSTVLGSMSDDNSLCHQGA